MKKTPRCRSSSSGSPLLTFRTLYLLGCWGFFLLAIMYGLLYFSYYSCDFGQYHLLLQLCLNGRVFSFSFSKGLQYQSTNFSEFYNHLLANITGHIHRTHPLGEDVQESSKDWRLDRQLCSFHSHPCQELILLHGTNNATSLFLYFSTRKWVSQYLYISENYGA